MGQWLVVVVGKKVLTMILLSSEIHSMKIDMVVIMMTVIQDWINWNQIDRAQTPYSILLDGLGDLDTTLEGKPALENGQERDHSGGNTSEPGVTRN